MVNTQKSSSPKRFQYQWHAHATDLLSRCHGGICGLRHHWDGRGPPPYTSKPQKLQLWKCSQNKDKVPKTKTLKGLRSQWVSMNTCCMRTLGLLLTTRNTELVPSQGSTHTSWAWREPTGSWDHNCCNWVHTNRSFWERWERLPMSKQEAS